MRRSKTARPEPLPPKPPGEASLALTQAAAMTARQFRLWAERLIVALLVVGAIVIVVREPRRILTAVIEDPWTTISIIGLSGGIGWIFGWRAQRDD